MPPAKPAAFSRLQLAAALLEYDNDPDNPDAPYHSAHESAIFAHLRRHVPLSRSRRSTDYLGVQVPSEVGSDPPNRKSKASIDALRNPFGNADDEDESADEGDVEVDLTSWGLDAFMEKNKVKGKGKAKAKSEILPNPHVEVPVRTAHSVAGDTPHSRKIRSMSAGTLNNFGAGGAFLDADGGHDSFRRMRSSADFDQFQTPQPPLQRRRASAHVLIETLPVQPPLHSVPFPSVSVSGRSSPGPEEILRPGSRSSRLDLQTAHARTQSNGSMGSKALLNDVPDDDANPFTVQPPSPDRASRFDPKANRGRTMSNGSMGTVASKNVLADDNVFSVHPPSPSRSSRFDPKMHGRTLSINSLGTRMLLENDVDTESRRDRPLSTLELLRPKVLVMPSPLQNIARDQPPPHETRPQSGFQASTDDSPLPLPPRPSRLAVPVASNSFTPNPRANLSLSQLAFRNTLVVGGQRDIAYSDIDRHFPRALKDGEQAHFEMEEEVSPVASFVPLPPVPQTEFEIRRPAGRLYGRSLIDNLEHRKLEMKQMARTFQGDNRPSMMIRGQRPITLIDPDLLGTPPNFQSPDNRTSAFMRRSSSAGPLLDPNSEKPPAIGVQSFTGNLPQSRSVFGVDTLWDREMQKLKEIETQERVELKEHKKREQEDTERRQRKKKKKRGKLNFEEAGSMLPQPDANLRDASESHISSVPPILPAIQKPVLRRIPVADDDMPSESESDDDVPLGQSLSRITDKVADNWVAESSDEDEGPRRTIGVGPRYVGSSAPLTKLVPSRGEDEDSEEDLPLTAAAERIARRATQSSPPRLEDEDEDEDKPLAAVLSESKISLGASKASLPNFSFGNLSGGRPSTNDDDDDEQPLGLRGSRLPAMASHTSLPLMGGGDADEDDDKPLALHPEQQRKTQYQMLAQLQQQQQRQQQMMMQAQMHNSFYFGNPAMMGSGFFGQPINMGMGIPPLMGIPMPPSPPPVHDPAKFGRVDRWRHDVAVEGEP